MFAKAKCLGDGKGLTKGTVYPILSFGESVVTVIGDDNKIVRVPHVSFDNEKHWELQPLEGAKKPDQPKPTEGVSNES